MAWMDIDSDSAQVGFPPPFVYLGFLLLGILADSLLQIDFLVGDTTFIQILGEMALIVGGLAIMISGSARFRAHDNEVKPWKTTSRVVSDGIFGFTRNPMYLGMAGVYLGLALAAESLVALLLLPAVILIIRTQVIAREERYLEAKFSNEYLAYKQRVRRWF